jgi:glycosyltransferase involved in cell wall biosynthesis
MDVAPGSVWLDARGTQSAAHGERGVARYIAEHARALVDLAPEAIGSIGLEPGVPPPPSMESLVGSGLFAWHRRTRSPDRPVPGIYHVMSPFEVTMDFDDVWPPWIRDAGSRLVVTLYDLIPMLMREQYIADWGHNGVAWMARLGLIRAAHQVLTISQHTANDAMEHLGIPEERITVVDSGVSGVHSSLVAGKAEADAVLQRTLPRIRPGFLLYVGGDDHRKNMDGTIRAYAQLPQSVRDAHQLVIAFRVGPLRRLELRAFAQPLGIRPRDLVLTGFVTDEQLAALYRSCELFVFPSLYEGAGLPILEAMSCGAPVAASRTTSIPELLGDLEATFDPADPADIARCLREVLESPAVLDDLRERSRRRVQLYTWERVAKRTIEGYERAEQTPHEHRPRRAAPAARRRLAVVTPWPPQESGAARYSRRLVEELAEHAEVEVIVSADENGLGFDRSLEPNVKLQTDAEFDWLRGVHSYDRCLFVLGGSRFHMHALEQMMKVPGLVLAHDVQLLSLYGELHRHRHLYDPYWLEKKLAEMYGERIPMDELRRIPYEGPRADGHLAMTGEVQSHAERVLVHSRYQAELLRLDRAPGAAPTEVVPFGIPSIEPAANGGGGTAPPVVAIGARAARPELTAALRQVASSHLGIEVRVLPEDPEERSSALPGAGLALCLDSDARGGRPSAIVGELIAARVPTIVSDVGWQGELPDRVVLPVPADFDAATLAGRMTSALDDEDERRSIREAQDSYAAENSFARVAERFAQLLSL